MLQTSGDCTITMCAGFQDPAGHAPILTGVFLFGSVQLFLTGLLGEYTMGINTRVMNKPLVVEEKRLNF